jgi:hypothetical protein
MEIVPVQDSQEDQKLMKKSAIDWNRNIARILFKTNRD